MKKSIIYLFLLMSTSLFAQTYYAPTTGVLSSYSGGCPIGANTGTFVDDGGLSSNYSSNITDIYQTFCPTVAGQSIRLTFSSFNMENNVDYIKIANGPAQNSPVFTSAPADAFGWITGNLGTTVPFSYTATNSSGCLTVRTYTDAGTQRAGFVATISTVNNGTALSSGNSDCSNSTFICSNTAFNDVSYGPGLSPNDACGNSSCLTGEVYSNWYTFTAKTTGTLTLNIAPNTPTDDFDFALYGPNVACGAAVAPIRCSFAGVSGSTGLSNTAFDASEDVSGDSYVSQLNVIAGETYKLMVNNWSPGGAGFNMTFGGTATLGTNPPSVNSVANCGAQSTILTATPDVLGGAYLWNTGATTPSITVSPSSTTSYSCVYTINSCSSVTSGSGTITVTPTPTATISYSGSPFCTSLGTQAVNLSGTNSYTGGTFSSAGGLSINSTTGLITPSSSTSGPYTVTYAIPAVGACPSTNATTSITIDGTPSAIAGGSQSICAGSSALVSGASSANGTIAWTHNGAGTITNPTSLTPTYNSTLADAGNTVTLTMTVTSNNSCGGTATASYSVVVKAIPTVTNATLTQAICSGSTATFTPTSGVASTTFGWTASLTSGTVSGFSASGSGNISDVLTNSTSTSGSVTYVITPTGPATTSCVGTSVNFVVTVNPKPAVTNATLTQAICSGSNATFNPNSGVASTTFAWTASLTSGTVTGFNASGTGNISETLTNTSTTSSGSITYVVTPTGPATTSCVGTPVNFVVTVNPIPTVTNATLTQVICSGSTATFTPTSGVASTTYVWTASLTSGTVTGFSVSGSENISNVLTNATTTSGTVTYVITPTGPATTSCVGTPVNFVVTVSPKPTFTSTFVSPTTCNGTDGTFSLHNLDISTNYTINYSSPSISSSSFTSDGFGDYTFNNLASGAYTFTLTNNLTGCVSSSVTSISLVNPGAPVLSITDPSAVCSPATVDLTAFSVTSGSSGVVSLSYWNDSGALNPLSNPNSISVSNTYYIKAENGTCSDIKPVVVLINNKPLVDAPSNIIACDSYSLPVLSNGNYYTLTGGNGTALFTGNTISSTQSVYVYASSGTIPNCVSENSFNITINTTPIADSPVDVEVCDDYVLPTLANGNYYSATNGSGLITNGTVLHSTQTLYVYATTNTVPACHSENSFNVVINVTPIVDDIADFNVCDSMKLPIITGSNLSGNEAYYLGPNGANPQYFPGDIVLNSIPVIYIYDSVSNCHSEQSFSVNFGITKDPTFIYNSFCEGTSNGPLAVTSPGGNFDFYPAVSNGATIDAFTGIISNEIGGSTYPVRYITNGTCPDTLILPIIINTVPNAPTLSNDTTYCFSETLVNLTAVAHNGGLISWYSDNSLSNLLGTGLMFMPSNSTEKYYVTETNTTASPSCESVPSSVTITVQSCEVEIPSAFTPDDDKTNDIWELKFLDVNFPENIVKIYNRWGNLVFESQSGKYELYPWDGKIDGIDLPVSSYFYVIEHNDGKHDPKKGTVTIIRK